MKNLKNNSESNLFFNKKSAFVLTLVLGFVGMCVSKQTETLQTGSNPMVYVFQTILYTILFGGIPFLVAFVFQKGKYKLYYILLIGLFMLFIIPQISKI